MTITVFIRWGCVVYLILTNVMNVSLSFYSVCSDKLLGIHTLTDVTDRAAIYMPRGLSAANAEEL